MSVVYVPNSRLHSDGQAFVGANYLMSRLRWALGILRGPSNTSTRPTSQVTTCDVEVSLQKPPTGDLLDGPGLASQLRFAGLKLLCRCVAVFGPASRATGGDKKEESGDKLPVVREAHPAPHTSRAGFFLDLLVSLPRVPPRQLQAAHHIT